jgi:hypothetical protein
LLSPAVQKTVSFIRAGVTKKSNQNINKKGKAPELSY